MLKETGTVENIGFVVIISIIGGISIGREGSAAPGYAYLPQWKRLNFISIIDSSY